MSTPLYGLRRGKQWVKRPMDYGLPSDPALWRRDEPLFVPGLTLADGLKGAWVTPSSELAECRCRLLRMVPPGWSTRVERVA